MGNEKCVGGGGGAWTKVSVSVSGAWTKQSVSVSEWGRRVGEDGMDKTKWVGGWGGGAIVKGGGGAGIEGSNYKIMTMHLTMHTRTHTPCIRPHTHTHHAPTTHTQHASDHTHTHTHTPCIRTHTHSMSCS